MKKVKKVFKYATGEEIPDGAVYLSTIKQTEIENGEVHGKPYWIKCWLVWHYFLVEVETQ